MGEKDATPLILTQDLHDSQAHIRRVTMAETRYDTQDLENGYRREEQTKKSPSSQELEEAEMLNRVNTTITLSPEQFEKLYLNPLTRREHTLTKRFANPTPLYVKPLPPLPAVSSRGVPGYILPILQSPKTYTWIGHWPVLS